MEPAKPSKPPYAVERSARHLQRPGFHITELTIGLAQEVPWHYHSQVHDTFYVLEGRIKVSFRDPEEEITLGPGETTVARVRRPHRASNVGDGSATFLVLQGFGTYDFIGC